ncbi:probable replication factor C subunit 1 isoform X2 [Aethina tumida]|uniref:probable replication factor C subunit 1 isoform X2 n=1 Tax=Aethina tumida TaxID=116153 RepID=UPI002148D156|nr:probable replication factor C subunit 1 isoform X2 [Aethina tumida]
MNDSDDLSCISQWFECASNTATDTWQAVNFCSILDKDKLHNIQTNFRYLETNVKLQILVSFFYLEPIEVDVLKCHLNKVVDVAVDDIEGWVSSLGKLVGLFLATGSLSFENLDYYPPAVVELVNELRPLLNNHVETYPSIDMFYMNQSSMSTTKMNSKRAQTHFQIKKKTKAQILKERLAEHSLQPTRPSSMIDRRTDRLSNSNSKINKHNEAIKQSVRSDNMRKNSTSKSNEKKSDPDRPPLPKLSIGELMRQKGVTCSDLFKEKDKNGIPHSCKSNTSKTSSPPDKITSVRDTMSLPSNLKGSSVAYSPDSDVTVEKKSQYFLPKKTPKRPKVTPLGRLRKRFGYVAEINRSMRLRDAEWKSPPAASLPTPPLTEAMHVEEVSQPLSLSNILEEDLELSSSSNDDSFQESTEPHSANKSSSAVPQRSILEDDLFISDDEEDTPVNSKQLHKSPSPQKKKTVHGSNSKSNKSPTKLTKKQDSKCNDYPKFLSMPQLFENDDVPIENSVTTSAMPQRSILEEDLYISDEDEDTTNDSTDSVAKINGVTKTPSKSVTPVKSPADKSKKIENASCDVKTGVKRKLDQQKHDILMDRRRKVAKVKMLAAELRRLTSLAESFKKNDLALSGTGDESNKQTGGVNMESPVKNLMSSSKVENSVVKGENMECSSGKPSNDKENSPMPPSKKKAIILQNIVIKPKRVSDGRVLREFNVAGGLTQEKRKVAQEIFEVQDNLTLADKVLIINFLSGSTTHPSPHLGANISLKLSDRNLFQSDANRSEIHLNMYPDSGRWAITDTTVAQKPAEKSSK